MNFIRTGPNKRVCAFFIDSIIAGICGGIVSLLSQRDLSWIVWSLLILSKDCFGGRSIGKRLIGTQVVGQDDLPVKPIKAILRNFFMILPIFPFVEYFIMLRDKQEGKRVGDKVAKTKVNDLKPQMKDGIFLWISIGLAVVVVVLQIGLGLMLISQNPELLK